MAKHFAIMLHHGLGDVICALPALWAADRHLGREGRFDIVVKSPLEAGVLRSVDWQGRMRVHYLNAGPPWRRIAHTLAVAIRLRAARPDVFLAPHVTSHDMAARLARLVGAPWAVLPAATEDERHVAKVRGEHKTRYYARFLGKSGLPMDIDQLCFPPLAQGGRQPDGGLRLVLAPAVGAAGEQHKSWPAIHFSALANAMIERWPDARLVLFAAPPERPLLERVLAGVSEEKRSRVELLTPPAPELAAEALVGASCVVTSCSGASHLAAWADAPIVGIYGPTNPGFTGPFSSKLHVIRKGYACSPCYRADFISGCGTPVCMTDIMPGDVLPVVAATVAGLPPSVLPILETTHAIGPDRRIAGAVA